MIPAYGRVPLLDLHSTDKDDILRPSGPESVPGSVALEQERFADDPAWDNGRDEWTPMDLDDLTSADRSFRSALRPAVSAEPVATFTATGITHPDSIWSPRGSELAPPHQPVTQPAQFYPASSPSVWQSVGTAGSSPSASTRSDTSTTPLSLAWHPSRQGTPPTHRHVSGAAALPSPHGGQDDGRNQYRGLQHHPAGLERGCKREFMVGHRHAQIGQLCADLRRTCHGAVAAHSGGTACVLFKPPVLLLPCYST